MSKDLLKEKWISVRGAPTYILCQGSKKNHNTVVIIIPVSDWTMRRVELTRWTMLYLKTGLRKRLRTSLFVQQMHCDYISVPLLQLFGILCNLAYHLQHSDAIQCYSCKTTASNEIEANIRCLETANLEDCSEFYQYYSEIETAGGGGDDNDLVYDYDFDVQLDRTSALSRDFPRRRARFRRKAGDGGARGDYQYADELMTSLTTTRSAPPGERRGKNGTDVISERQMSLPTDPEHHCYSTAKKNAWESYTVEKGCKKIIYCRAHRENMPAVWTLPWNFCCDRSRCNAKLVKDKPQRIFAMGCRRTDDCIQGHITRHMCPQLFQSCPRVSSSVIKMECRVRNRPSTQPPGFRAPIYGSAYFNQFKDKKCFCARGYYPRGPVCSGAETRETPTAVLVNSAVVSVAVSSLIVLNLT